MQNTVANAVVPERRSFLTRKRSAARGRLIVNADDWGCDQMTTVRTLDCLQSGAVSSVSAMVFMADSERSAALAAEHNVDAGLHLNLTTAFTSTQVSGALCNHQQKLARWLRSRRLAPAIYRPDLVASFEYVVKAQLDEYQRLYAVMPGRIDGHHHMHLCSNVVFQKLLPEKTIIRRNFSFQSGEKGALNRRYRAYQDKRLSKRHQMTDYFFSLPPMDVPGRLERIGQLAATFSVEVETHPVNSEEYKVLMTGELRRRAGNAEIAQDYSLDAARNRDLMGARR